MAKGSSKTVQSKFAAYKVMGTCAANGIKRINRHLKKHPNDAQARSALGTVGFSRKSPNEKKWTFKTRSLAALLGSVVPNHTKTVIKGMFSIEARVSSNV